jgi:hypothetical protein
MKNSGKLARIPFGNTRVFAILLASGTGLQTVLIRG